MCLFQDASTQICYSLAQFLHCFKFVELHLNCTQSASGAGLFVGEFLKLTCYVTYAGMVTPSIQWIDENNSLITNATTTSTDGFISSFIQIPAYMNFTSQITFKVNVNNSTYDNYSWTSESIPVGRYTFTVVCATRMKLYRIPDVLHFIHVV